SRPESKPVEPQLDVRRMIATEQEDASRQREQSNVTIEGKNVNEVHVTAPSGTAHVLNDGGRVEVATTAGEVSIWNYQGQVQATVDNGQARVWNEGRLVSITATGGEISVDNRGDSVLATTTSGNVTVQNRGGGAMNVQTSTGDVSVQSDRGSVRVETDSGTIDVVVQAQSYRGGGTFVFVGRPTGDVQVRINGSANQAQVTVIVDGQTFTKPLTGSGIVVSLEENELDINSQTYKLKPSNTSGRD
ncbi:MAG: hypothetical protein J2P36_17860, partial [Ktedonobacteraceae bacterium]|nr:hypothetical protein [Ktedonobacteraceae bacterium]